jgi:hypothetical protein
MDAYCYFSFNAFTLFILFILTTTYSYSYSYSYLSLLFHLSLIPLLLLTSMGLGSTQPLIEMSTRNLPGGTVAAGA